MGTVEPRLLSHGKEGQGEVILNMSSSPDGIAARKNGSTDFLEHGEWDLLVALAHEVGTLHAFDGLVRVVLSRNPRLGLEPGWQVTTSPQQALDLLEAAGHTRALLAGGATTNSAFARGRLLDEIILYVGSVIVGRGLPCSRRRTSISDCTCSTRKR